MLPLPATPSESSVSHHDPSHNGHGHYFRGMGEFSLPHSPNCLSSKFFSWTMSPTQFHRALTLSRCLLLSSSHWTLDLTAPVPQISSTPSYAWCPASDNHSAQLIGSTALLTWLPPFMGSSLIRLPQDTRTWAGFFLMESPTSIPLLLEIETLLYW